MNSPMALPMAPIAIGTSAYHVVFMQSCACRPSVAFLLVLFGFEVDFHSLVFVLLVGRRRSPRLHGPRRADNLHQLPCLGQGVLANMLPQHSHLVALPQVWLQAASVLEAGRHPTDRDAPITAQAVKEAWHRRAPAVIVCLPIALIASANTRLPLLMGGEFPRHSLSDWDH